MKIQFSCQKSNWLELPNKSWYARVGLAKVLEVEKDELCRKFSLVCDPQN